MATNSHDDGIQVVKVLRSFFFFVQMLIGVIGNLDPPFAVSVFFWFIAVSKISEK